MDKNAWWKWLLLVMLVSVSLALVYPPKDKLKWGIDLKGGVSFVLQVKTEGLSEDARADAAARALEVIRNRVDPDGVREPIIYLQPGSHRVVVQMPGIKTADRDEVVRTLQSAAYLEFRMVHDDNDRLVQQLFDKELAPAGYKILSVDDSFGGVSRRNRFYVRESTRELSTAEDLALREQLKRFQIQPGYEFMLMREERQGRAVYAPYYVSLRPQLTGESLETASIDYQRFGEPVVSLRFNSTGAKRFGNLTADNRPGGPKNPSPDGRRYLAIVLDGTLYSAPFIRTAIYDGNAIIEGNFTIQEAQHLAVVLRAGSLPAPVEVVEERNVDPALGHDSIRSGILATLYGSSAVVVFMLLYYLLCGGVANLALFLNLILFPLGMVIASGFLSMLADQVGGSKGIHLPTLTLPGIAGFALTIGMAVDANVLIFERMREEQALGKKFRAVIDAGYAKAFSAIFDSNITTLLTAVILFWQGTGPIRGFAVTLTAGIIVSMYTVLVVTRMVFNLLANRTSISSVKMLQLFRTRNIDFIRMKNAGIALSLIVIIGTLVVFFQKGEHNFGVDFTGGKSIVFQFDQKVPASEVRASAKTVATKEPFVQYQQELTADEAGVREEYLEVKVGFDEGEPVKQKLLADFAGAGFRVVKEDSVGPQIGHELRRQSIWAVSMGLLGIIIYISFRFQFAFAVGAIVALVHDVLVTVGVYCLLGRQLSLPTIAALLTIVGYSVNDTIVIFDRIREDLKLYRDRSFKDVANLSINQTLSRTVLTSFTTLLVVGSLLVFGGGAINDFALAMFIGMVAGVYSTIFIATPVVLLWHRERSAEPGKAAAKA
jgi:SecD/SecF fusion protein